MQPIDVVITLTGSGIGVNLHWLDQPENVNKNETN